MQDLIKVVNDNKDKLLGLSPVDFVDKFNDIVEYDAYDYNSPMFFAVLNNRSDYDEYGDEGIVYIISERTKEIVYTYAGSNCSCDSWIMDKEEDIAADILGEIKNHECKGEEE